MRFLFQQFFEKACNDWKSRNELKCKWLINKADVRRPSELPCDRSGHITRHHISAPIRKPALLCTASSGIFPHV